MPELPRIKQALLGRVRGTPQPTTLRRPEALSRRGRLAGRHGGHAGYNGSENVRVTTEAAQAAIYADMVGSSSCDPDVAQLNFFGFYDERNRAAGIERCAMRTE